MKPATGASITQRALEPAFTGPARLLEELGVEVRRGVVGSFGRASLTVRERTASRTAPS